jgi:hypothetical protein
MMDGKEFALQVPSGIEGRLIELRGWLTELNEYLIELKGYVTESKCFVTELNECLTELIIPPKIKTANKKTDPRQAEVRSSSQKFTY